MRLLLSTVVFLLLPVLAAKAQVKTPGGEEYLLEEQYGRARTWFLEKLKNSPGDVSALVGLGNSCMGTNNADSAMMAYQKAAALDPLNHAVWAGMGAVALAKNDLRGESACFDRARRAGKANAEVCTEIAESCIKYAVKDTSVALLYHNLGLRANPKFSALHLSSGNLSLLQGKYGEAVNAYQRALFFDPESALACRKLGIAHTLLHNYKDAQKAFNKSLEINPAQILVYKELGNLHFATGNYSVADTTFRVYMSRAEITPDDRERFAIILFFNKKYGEASALLEGVPSGGNNESVRLRLEGYIAFETGDYQKGVECMRKFFSLHNPGKIIPSDYLYYSRILVKTGNDSLAMDCLRKALVPGTFRKEILDELAKLASRNHRHAEAAAIYLQMEKNGEDRMLSLFLAGKEYYFEGYNLIKKTDSLSVVYKKNRVSFRDSLAMRKAATTCLILADSAFTVVTRLNTGYAGGFLWKGRVMAILHPDGDNAAAKDAYATALEILLKGDPENNKKMIIECYRYLGYFYFMEYERMYRTNKQQSAGPRSKSAGYFSKIIQLDPADRQANAVIQKMKQP